MARYIDAEKITFDLSGLVYIAPDDFIGLAKYFADQVKRQPTADVRENVRGEWKIKAINTYELAYGSTGYEPVYECSECGCVEESYLRLDEPIMPEDADFPNFCPNCGADMRGDNNE